MDTTALQVAVDALSFKDGRDTYRAKRAEHETQWAAWLHQQYAPHLSKAQADVVYAKAWEDGHADGYSQVESEYIDLIAFLGRVGQV